LDLYQDVTKMVEMSENKYTTDFSLEDFHQMVKDLENDSVRRYKEFKDKPDDSYRQMAAIAKEKSGAYMLDNGMVVSPHTCRSILDSLNDIGK